MHGHRNLQLKRMFLSPITPVLCISVCNAVSVEYASSGLITGIWTTLSIFFFPEHLVIENGEFCYILKISFFYTVPLASAIFFSILTKCIKDYEVK